LTGEAVALAFSRRNRQPQEGMGRMTEAGSERSHSPGLNQRSQVRMTATEVEDFLQQQRSLSLATLNPDGSIHLVAMYYTWFEGAVTFTSKARAQKILNLRRNPTITVMSEAGDSYFELRGVQIQGRAEIIDDPDRMLEVGRVRYERENGPYTPEAREGIQLRMRKRVAVKVHPVKIVSWDHRKL
jgi:PPOX class probable F420-dependent enzyme